MSRRFIDVNAAYGFGACDDDDSSAQAMRRRPVARQHHEAGGQPQGLQVPMLLPGITINTSPDNFSPIRQDTARDVRRREPGAVRRLDHGLKAEAARFLCARPCYGLVAHAHCLSGAKRANFLAWWRSMRVSTSRRKATPSARYGPLLSITHSAPCAIAASVISARLATPSRT